MVHWMLQFDMRAPAWGTPIEDLYSTALEMSTWADKLGCPEITVAEHHASEDRFLPSPMVFASAIGAVTKRAKITVGCLLLPLHHPARIAEDINIADIISGGRIQITAGVGYVPHEFKMYGYDMKNRGKLMDEKLPLFLAALRGDEFEYLGTKMRVTPPSLQSPRVPVLGGGGVRSSALRAARYCDGFYLTPQETDLIDVYKAECARLGRPVGPIERCNFPYFIYVTDDPERAWAKVGPHILHEQNMYGKIADTGGANTGYQGRAADLTEISQVRDNPLYSIVTPDEAIKICNSQGPHDRLRMKALIGGLSPDVAWESLELFASKVLPHIKLAPPLEIPILPVLGG